MSAAHSLLSARGLGYEAGGRWLLRNVDIDLHAGEIVTVIGPNGAGKTTLLRLLLGLIKPSAGRVERRQGSTVGYLPQRFDADPSLPLSVRGFLALPKPRPSAALRESLAEVGVAHLLDAPLQSLSGGETQRVLLARALLREPDLLVLDEPAQAVDFSGQAELYELIARTRDARGCGVLIVSHDLHLVMASTDTVLCLNQHICCAGKPEAVERHPEYLKLFGTAAEALAIYQHEHDHHHDLEGKPVPDA
ncbi:MAG: metal ABC transporter ATP-binding protein [Rhodovibrionaceae bacterium]